MRARELLRRLDDVEVTELTSASLAAAIGGSVRRGQLPAGTDLPSERDLAAELGRSRGTIARAYEQLRADGLAYTRHGAGTTIGCCAGPWASSRAAELEAIVPVVATAASSPTRTIELRSTHWGATAAPGAPAAGMADGPLTEAASDVRADVLRDVLAGQGLDPHEDRWVAVDGATRALEVALAALLTPGDRILVPALCDPGWLALLRVRALHPVALPVTADGRADVPGWLRRLRTRSAAVALVSATHAAPAGAVLAPHERRLLVEAAAQSDVTLVDDLRHAELWLEQPPPPALATFDADDRTVTIGSTSSGAPSGAALGWLHASSGPLAQRLRAVATTIDAAPSAATVAAAAGGHHRRSSVLLKRRQHLIDHTALTIRLVTPAAPRVAVAPAAGGPFRLLRLGGVPGSVVADAAGDRGVLVHPAAAWAVGAGDPPGVVVSLTGGTEELVAGLRVVIEVARDLT